jgi:hypothetical protein
MRPQFVLEGPANSASFCPTASVFPSDGTALEDGAGAGELVVPEVGALLHPDMKLATMRTTAIFCMIA